MIASAIQTARSMLVDHFPFGWFDIALFALLAFGLFRGRRNGMTKEVLPMLQWVATVLACGLGCEIIGQMFINLSGWGMLPCYLLGYFCVMFVVYLLFHFLKNMFKERLTGSNFFGRGEYYLGMFSGMIRYGCMVMVALALLNAPYYSEAQLAKTRAYNNRWYGGGMKEYSGDFIPSLDEMQASVFVNSLIGPFIKTHLHVLLINTASVGGNNQAPSAPQPKQGVITIGK